AHRARPIRDRAAAGERTRLLPTADRRDGGGRREPALPLAPPGGSPPRRLTRDDPASDPRDDPGDRAPGGWRAPGRGGAGGSSLGRRAFSRRRLAADRHGRGRSPAAAVRPSSRPGRPVRPLGAAGSPSVSGPLHRATAVSADARAERDNGEVA